MSRPSCCRSLGMRGKRARSDRITRPRRTADLLPAAHSLLAALHDDTPAVLAVPGSLQTARTERRCRQLRGCQAVRFPLVKRHRIRNGADNPVTKLWLSFPCGPVAGLAGDWPWPVCGVPLSGDCPACLPTEPAYGCGRCAAQLLPSDTDMTERDREIGRPTHTTAQIDSARWGNVLITAVSVRRLPGSACEAPAGTRGAVRELPTGA